MGDSGGQRSLVCCNPLGREESDMIEQLSNSSVTMPRSEARNVERPL